MNKTILVTGGAGYIGSHTTLLLLQAGYEVVVLDNLCNASLESIQRVTRLSGRTPTFVEGSVCDYNLLERLLVEHAVTAVIHFAGLKDLVSSLSEPLNYYRNNVGGTLALLRAMEATGVSTLAFSSSATVYGNPETLPVTEDHLVGHMTTPYGRTKFIIEQMLMDLAASDSRWRVALLRYFNPVGAHQSGQIGEDTRGVPRNLVPYITQVAAGKLPELRVFGNDYPTIDGTGVRDYVHVMDLAEGHIAALDALKTLQGVHVWNLGTGQGYSVLQIIQAFQEISGCTIPFRVVPRRPGDVAACYANPAKALRDLGWTARRPLFEMMRDAWRWHTQNPNGYAV